MPAYVWAGAASRFGGSFAGRVIHWKIQPAAAIDIQRPSQPSGRTSGSESTETTRDGSGAPHAFFGNINTIATGGTLSGPATEARHYSGGAGSRKTAKRRSARRGAHALHGLRLTHEGRIAGACRQLLLRLRDTANLALQENRDVYAVPGPVTSVLSEGPNRLIEAGATPIIDYELKKFIQGIVFGLVITFFAGFIPARKAAKVDPVSIFRK